jgi:hypothetical protein
VTADETRWENTHKSHDDDIGRVHQRHPQRAAQPDGMPESYARQRSTIANTIFFHFNFSFYSFPLSSLFPFLNIKEYFSKHVWWAFKK